VKFVNKDYPSLFFQGFIIVDELHETRTKQGK